MKTRHSKTDHNGHGQHESPEALLARVKATKQLVKSARKHLKLLKLECKQARKSLKQAKKAARRVRKEAKEAEKMLRAKAAAAARRKARAAKTRNGHSKRTTPVVTPGAPSARPLIPVSHTPAQVSVAAA